jgi:hypothetical protein
MHIQYIYLILNILAITYARPPGVTKPTWQSLGKANAPGISAANPDRVTDYERFIRDWPTTLKAPYHTFF